MIKNIIKSVCVAVGFMFFGSLGLNAQNAVKLTQNDGIETYFLLADKPVVTMNEDNIVLNTLWEQITYPMDELLTFEFVEYEISKLDEVMAKEIVFKISGESLDGYNLTPNSQIFVFDLSGKRMASAATDENGNASIYIGNLPKGVYIINSTTSTFKFHKK